LWHTPIVAELPDHDFSIFDSRMVARLEDEDDRFLGVSPTEEPTQVLTVLQACDAAWHHAPTFPEHMATRAE